MRKEITLRLKRSSMEISGPMTIISSSSTSGPYCCVNCSKTMATSSFIWINVKSIMSGHCWKKYFLHQLSSMRLSLSAAMVMATLRLWGQFMIPFLSSAKEMKALGIRPTSPIPKITSQHITAIQMMMEENGFLVQQQHPGGAARVMTGMVIQGHGDTRK